MNLLELKVIVDSLVENLHKPEDVIVCITTSEPSFGGRSKTGVRGVHLGIDWEKGQLRIEPEEFLKVDVDKEKIVNEFRNKRNNSQS